MLYFIRRRGWIPVKIDDAGALWRVLPVSAGYVNLVGIAIMQYPYIPECILHVLLLTARIDMIRDYLRIDVFSHHIRCEAVYAPVKLVPLPRHV